jgi:hypothetical protein
VLIYVEARRVDDCFNCFNRIPTLRYSIFAGIPPAIGGRSKEMENDNSPQI